MPLRLFIAPDPRIVIAVDRSRTTTYNLHDGNSIPYKKTCSTIARTKSIRNLSLDGMNIGRHGKTEEATVVKTLQYFYNARICSSCAVTNVGSYEGIRDISYTGKEYDATKPYNLNARWYAPSLGRFITEDPIRDGGNWFAHCVNNPVSSTDPTGLREVIDEDGSGGLIVDAGNGEIGNTRTGETVNPDTPNRDWDIGADLATLYQNELSKTDCTLPYYSPPGVSVNTNIIYTEDYIGYYGLSWYLYVKNNGVWDYKQLDKKYEEFGNFNYGATGTALGLPADVLLRGAGWASVKADPRRASIYGRPLNKNPPYGDDAKDGYWIIQGINYAKTR
jgi:RHS repeat-associated protein